MTREILPPDLDALISLLDDPDAEAFRHVRDQISALGIPAVAPLEIAWENAFNPVMQRRIEELVHQIQVDQLFKDFQDWIADGAKSLLTGYALITRYQYPDLDPLKIQSRIEHIERDIWLELNNNLTPLEQVKVLNHILFLVYKFSGSTAGQPAPENYYLNILLESRQGTPLSLGILYLIASQRLNLPIKGIDLPRHFVLAYTNKPSEGTAGMDALEVQFYINPFARGAVFSRKELGEYLKQIGEEPEARFYLPCSNLIILKRVIEELQEAYRSSGKDEKADELERFREALGN
jgi:regulator of sirC expression with transglutaminase-like and TPR domain